MMDRRVRKENQLTESKKKIKGVKIQTRNWKKKYKIGLIYIVHTTGKGESSV